MKRLIFILIIALGTIASNAQIKLQTTNQSLIEQSVAPAFVEIVRPYVLRDKLSGETFKIEGKNNFNEVTSMAIMVKGGILTTKAGVAPWESDLEYNNFQDKYDGLALGIHVKVDGQTIIYDSIEEVCLSPKSEILYFIATDSNTDGLTLNTPLENVNGWVVLLTKEKDSSLATTSFSKNLKIKQGVEKYELERPLGNLKIIGGVYIEPTFTSIGTVEFRLCGIILEEGEKLVIVTTKSPLSSISTTSANSKQSKALVPVSKQTGKQKPNKKSKKK